MKRWFFSALCLASVSSFAQVSISDYSIGVDTRLDNLPASDITRLQNRVKIGFTISATGIVDIVGLASTGPSFNNDWATASTTHGAYDPFVLTFRNLYLRKVTGNVSIEAGAMSPEPTVGAAGLAPSGWMDGVRVNVNTTIGKFKVVAGSLGSFKTPNAFERKFQGNFIEIEMDRKVFDDIMTQTAVEHYNSDVFLRESIKVDLKLFGDKVFKVFADTLYDISRGSASYELGTEFDLLQNIVNKYDNRVNLKLYYSDVNQNIPDRNSTITAFYTYGPRFTAQVGGKIDKAGNVNWNARYAIGQVNRFDAGISIKFGPKKR